MESLQSRIKISEIIATHCPVCEGQGDDRVLYEEKLGEEGELEPKDFSARKYKIWNRGLHFRLVRCRRCGLVRSNPILSPDKIGMLYTGGHLDYEEDIPNLKKTYGYYLGELSKFHAGKERFLEIGCGNGFALDTALELGYRDVWGVEPSLEAKERASVHVRNKIITELFKPGLFEANSFDVICMFQVLDHIVDLNAFLQSCRSLLKPNGLLFSIHHDVDAWSVKLLGERHPIFDAMHMHLFNRSSGIKLLEKNGFSVVMSESTYNMFSVRHCLKLFPLPLRLKDCVMSFVDKSGVAKINLKFKPGNLRLIAKKPC